MVTKACKNKILLFGGTYEGRMIAEFCDNNNISIDVRVATDYGKEVISHIKNVYSGRLDENEILKLLQENEYSHVIDATHPFAAIISQNIKRACASINTAYIRVLRETIIESDDGLIYFDDIQNAVEYLNKFDGNIFATTGSKELYKFKDLTGLCERLIVRALPFEYALSHCKDMGIPPKNIVLMQGPFDKLMNIALFKKYDAKFLITKQTGKTGGFDEKILAAKELSIEVIVISKPYDDGISLSDVKKFLLEKVVI